jgi:tubulin beta
VPLSSTCDAQRGNDSQLGRSNVLYPEALGGKYVPSTVLFDLKPGVIESMRASPLGKLLHPGDFMNQNADARINWANVLNLKPLTGTRPSVRV